MSHSYFPLHWKCTGNKWWFASPIDLAAANGHYDLVRELLHLDMNLFIKLTSLRRIHRLETLWDDDHRFVHAAKCRSFVARNLFYECQTKNNKNSLIRAGYGGWLLYTASAAGDNGFVQELLERYPLLVFGEGEFGVADILYAAARSKNTKVFKSIFEFAISPRCLFGEGGGSEEEFGGDIDSISILRLEIVNRAVLAAARGGNLEVLKELIGGSSDVLAYRDNQGATILHASAGRGQVEVVKDLVGAFDIIECRDNQGNTALHVAAFRAHFPVIETLIAASWSLPYLTNNDGDTFLHMVVAGFQSSGFRHFDHQMGLIRRLITGNIGNIHDIINVQNKNGRTAVHVAVIGNLHSELVELLMTIPSIDLNIEDNNGMSPLDLLHKQECSASLHLLIKMFILAGARPNSGHQSNTSAISSQLKIQPCTGNSPGTSFRVTDSEIFLYTGIKVSAMSERLSSSSAEEIDFQTSKKKPLSSLSAAAKRIKILLRLTNGKRKKNDDEFHDSTNSAVKWNERDEIPTPLRQTFSNGTSSLMNNKRTVAVRTALPSPSTKKKFTESLMQGVFQAIPLVSSFSKPQTPVSPFSCSQVSSPMSGNVSIDGESVEMGGASICSNSSVYSHGSKSSSRRPGFMNSKLIRKLSGKTLAHM